MINGKADVLKFSDTTLNSIDREIRVPMVIRLVELVNIVYKRRILLSRKNINIRDKYVCAYCGRNLRGHNKELTVDHIIPKYLGGKDTWENCITACMACNTNKGNRTLEQAGMTLLYQPYQMTVNDYIQKRLELSESYQYIKDVIKHLW
jgi:5-methylcytosine-specific restriction endonuclease McrA